MTSTSIEHRILVSAAKYTYCFSITKNICKPQVLALSRWPCWNDSRLRHCTVLENKLVDVSEERGASIFRLSLVWVDTEVNWEEELDGLRWLGTLPKPSSLFVALIGHNSGRIRVSI
jgi:hypothetical protein